MDSTTLSIIFGLFAAIGFAGSSITAKYPSKKLGGLKTTLYRSMITSCGFLLILITVYPETPFTLKEIGISLLISIGGYFPLLFFLKAINKGKLGAVSPITGSASGFTVIFAWLFFGETLRTTQYFGILGIIMGVILISINFKDIKNSNAFKISSGIPYALITCFLWGLFFSLQKVPISMIGPIFTAFLVEFMILISSITHIRLTKNDYIIPFKKFYKNFFGIAIFTIIGVLGTNFGMSIGKIGLVTAIAFSNPLIVSLYDTTINKEKLNRQQWIGILSAIIGIIIISLF